jgi:aminopeptidase N
MREGTAPTIHRLDHRAPAWWIRSAEFTFDLDPAKTIVAAKLAIERNAGVEPAPLVLDGEDLVLLRVLADGESVAFRHDGGRLVIEPPAGKDRFVLEVRNTCAPEKNTQLSGLYVSGGGFFTQCEAEGFRRITYFLDRPDVMAAYRVTLRADRTKYPVLLAGGNLVEEGPLPGGRHFATWHDPFPKPSYLFALVAADLVAREQAIRARNGREHRLQVWVRRGDLHRTEHAMRALVASIAWDEARFGLPLDLDRFMIVAVDDFNMGAMENKGLNLFNSKYVLASPATATDADHAAIESIVGHEYFHNWTGNRVTCRDWFQLSLKEGLTVFRDQEFSMDLAGSASARAVKRIEDVKKLRAMQFPEDAGAMAHPVRPDHYAAIDNFYTATVYEKGAEVVRMMHTLVGRDTFTRGLALYFERHDGQAVTCDDFAQAIADADAAAPGGGALASRLEAFKRWYSQAGTPRVHVRCEWEAASGRCTLVARQHTPATPGQPVKQPLVIPLRAALFSAAGAKLAPERVLVLEEAEQRFTFEGVAEAPVASLLRGFSAPVLLDDGLAEDALLVLLAHDDDAFVRWEAAQRLALERALAALGLAAPGTAGAEAPPAPRLGPRLLAAWRALLHDPGLDPAFKALALTLPADRTIAQHLQHHAVPVDPPRIHAVREALRLDLAASLAADWAHAFEANQVAEGYAPVPAQSGRRALANLALGMACLHAVATDDPVWPGRAYQRVKDGANLTESLGALSALVMARSPLAERALAHFHAAHRGDPIVIDPWFRVQALAPEPLAGDTAAPRVLERVRALLRHPDYTPRNPNRVKNLVIPLCDWNPAAFHRTDGAGAAFFTEQLALLDEINPQVAARLARCFDNWRALAEPYRAAAHEALKRAAARPGASADVREILERALAAD